MLHLLSPLASLNMQVTEQLKLEEAVESMRAHHLRGMYAESARKVRGSARKCAGVRGRVRAGMFWHAQVRGKCAEVRGSARKCAEVRARKCAESARKCAEVRAAAWPS